MIPYITKYMSLTHLKEKEIVLKDFVATASTKNCSDIVFINIS